MVQDNRLSANYYFGIVSDLTHCYMKFLQLLRSILKLAVQGYSREACSHLPRESKKRGAGFPDGNEYAFPVYGKMDSFSRHREILLPIMA